MRLSLLGSGLSGGVSFYRVAGPVSYMHKLDPALQIARPHPSDWVDFADSDWVLLNGAHSDGQVKGLEEAKSLGCKIWLDYDDAVGHVDWRSPRAGMFPNDVCLPNIQKCLCLADLVTVSTADVAKSINFSAAKIIPNAYDPRMHRSVNGASGKKTVLWRGSDTHISDLAVFDHMLERLALEHRDWEFVYIGQMPAFHMRLCLPNVKKYDSLPLVQFFNKMAEINPSVVIVPMEDTDFNRARSNIAWIEGTLAGGAVVAPAWPSWDIPAAHYTTIGEFYNQTERLMLEASERTRLYETSRRYIMDNLHLHKWASVRQDYLYAY